MIIGINGYARTGKDSVAAILIQDFGFERLAFADKLRESLYALNPTVTWDYKYGLAYTAKSVSTVQKVVDEFGWDGLKSTGWGKAHRELLQRFGTEVGRDILGQNIWVDATFAVVDDAKNYVVSDMRFKNEMDSVVSRNGKVIRVERPGIFALNDHISEVGLDGEKFDHVIQNNGSLEDLRNKVVGFANEALL